MPSSLSRAPEHAPPTDRVRVRRLPERGRYDRATIDAIIDAAIIGHVGFVIDGQPYVNPTAVWRTGDRVYWHGSSASRMLRATRDGVPVCVTVTHLDSLVIARSGFNHSAGYRSVVVLGRAWEIMDPGERLDAMEAFVEHLYPGRWAELRPPTRKELKATSILWTELSEASAKIRDGLPHDGPEDAGWPTWAGTIPLRLVTGTAEADPAGVLAGTLVPGLSGTVFGSEGNGSR
jgi:nitroimidazol reductase NimA-like FMN-containing flavoprotein (pyridoxamine 5'-phosphate oxidase superfamily)